MRGRVDGEVLAVVCWLAAIASVAPVAARAAEAEGSGELRSLVERIYQPNLNKRYEVKQFEGARRMSAGGREIEKREFYWVRKSLRRDYRTGEFYAGREAQGAAAALERRRFGAGEAYFGADARQRSPRESQYRTGEYRDGGGREAYDAGRRVRTGEVGDAGREFRGRGTAQGILDRLSDPSQALSVQQVREILNRND
mgnify:CR=1 FL=1